MSWIAARTEFELASNLRPIDASEFESEDLLRIFLLDHLQSDHADPDDHVFDYTSARYKKDKTVFFRLCGGSLGGKARGLAFARHMINTSGIREEFENCSIRVPRCAIIGTDEFDRFMKDNDLWEIAITETNNKKLEKAFVTARLSIDIKLKLESFLADNSYPLAVRSSGILEDSQYQPLSGTYETFMLPNNEKTTGKRLDSLITAIKRIFASTFKGEAKSLLENTAHRIEEEKMAIIIQEIVGQSFESGRFYPTFSGVLKNINFYPVSYMEREEGVAYLALGFGRTIVDGEKCLRISPKYPSILPQFYSIKATRMNSQIQFYGLDLNSTRKKGNDLQNYSLQNAEDDSSLKWVGSVISKDDNTLRDTLSKPGTRIVSFSPILKWCVIPLTKILNRMLVLGKMALGCPVEIEFAVNLFKDKKPEFCILQIKPMVLTGLKSIQSQEHDTTNAFCKSHITLGDGRLDEIHDLILVRSNTFDIAKTRDIAKEIEKLNGKIKNGKNYVLCGPGRWGSADPWLGIPVKWQQISQAKVIIEVGEKDLPIDPSFGSHFFQNITSMRLGYFTVNHKSKEDMLDMKWLKGQKIIQELKFTQWIQTDAPLSVVINGQSGEGHILKPLPEIPVVMDEEETTGI